jgi:hypothetical protein
MKGISRKRGAEDIYSLVGQLDAGIYHPREN